MNYKPNNYDTLLGTEGFSDSLLQTHFKLYQGYVKNTNLLSEQLAALVKKGEEGTPLYAELKRRFGWEFNGMRLHEYYFENMVQGGKRLSSDASLSQRIAKEYGSFEGWEKDFKATGAMRGIGWAILYFDPRSQSLYNCWVNEHDFGHLSGAVPLLVMDVFEHAFWIDYGTDRGRYIDSFFKAINWDMVVERLEKVEG